MENKVSASIRLIPKFDTLLIEWKEFEITIDYNIGPEPYYFLKYKTKLKYDKNGIDMNTDYIASGISRKSVIAIANTEIHRLLENNWEVSCYYDWTGRIPQKRNREYERFNILLE